VHICREVFRCAETSNLFDQLHRLPNYSWQLVRPLASALVLNVPPDHCRQGVASEPLHHNQRLEWNQAFGEECREEMLVDPAHDRDEAVIAVLAVNGGREEVLDIALIAAERIQQVLKSERADARMPRREPGLDLDLGRDAGQALVETGDD